jgi:hypothetical protein
VRTNWLNYAAAMVFFAASIRDWFFPGVLQIAPHPFASDEGTVSFVVGCGCIAAGLARYRQARIAGPKIGRTFR